MNEGKVVPLNKPEVITVPFVQIDGQLYYPETFTAWYSGMTKEKIDKAFERWMKERESGGS